MLASIHQGSVICSRGLAYTLMANCHNWGPGLQRYIASGIVFGWHKSLLLLWYTVMAVSASAI
jgi:hypothetical protein